MCPVKRTCSRTLSKSDGHQDAPRNRPGQRAEKLMRPEEIANVILFLVSPESSAITERLLTHTA